MRSLSMMNQRGEESPGGRHSTYKRTRISYISAIKAFCTWSHDKTIPTVNSLSRYCELRQSLEYNQCWHPLLYYFLSCFFYPLLIFTWQASLINNSHLNPWLKVSLTPQYKTVGINSSTALLSRYYSVSENIMWLMNHTLLHTKSGASWVKSWSHTV